MTPTKRNITTTQLLSAQEIARTSHDVDSDTKAPGQCWRFQRLPLEEIGLPSPGPGLDAKQAGKWYQREGYAINTQSTLPGDLYFWLDGRHGHVAMRIKGNRLSENSSVHSTNSSDARGTRKIADVRPPDIVIRLIQARTK
jgi:hypothetical protein